MNFLSYEIPFLNYKMSLACLSTFTRSKVNIVRALRFSNSRQEPFAVGLGEMMQIIFFGIFLSVKLLSLVLSY